MNLTNIYLTLLTTGIIILVFGIIKKNKKIKMISLIILILLALFVCMFFIALNFSNM